MGKPLKVEIEWKHLQRIAEYYQFPSAVFLSDLKLFTHKTRHESLKQKAELFDKIKDLVRQTEGGTQNGTKDDYKASNRTIA
jgi:hypothetical protein